MPKKGIVRMHSAITLMAPEFVLGVMPNGKPNVHKEGQDSDICEFAADFERWPMPEHYFRKAYEDMYQGCLNKARAAGLVLP